MKSDENAGSTDPKRGMELFRLRMGKHLLVVSSATCFISTIIGLFNTATIPPAQNLVTATAMVLSVMSLLIVRRNPHLASHLTIFMGLVFLFLNITASLMIVGDRFSLVWHFAVVGGLYLAGGAVGGLLMTGGAILSIIAIGNLTNLYAPLEISTICLVLATTSAVFFVFDRHAKTVIEALARYNLAAAEAANRDALTGLPNRKAFNEFASQWEGDGTALCAIMVDIDHFKSINDRYGHSGGDFVLRHTSALMTVHLKADHRAFRMGGEEFAVLMPRSSICEAMELADSIRLRIEEGQFDFEGHSIRVTASFGVAARLPVHAFVESLIKSADEALYAAKRAGRNRVVGAHEVVGPGKLQETLMAEDWSGPNAVAG